MRKTIEKMVQLARLRLPPAELERFAKKTAHILEYIEKLNAVDVSKIEATSHAIEIVNAFREDAVQKSDHAQKILEIAPSHYQNLFQVPRVIDEN